MPQTFTTRPEIRGTFGAVASTHWIASAVGCGILDRDIIEKIIERDSGKPLAADVDIPEA